MNAQEQPGIGMSPREGFNQQGRSLVASVVGGIATSVIAAGQPLLLPKSADNDVLLLAGDHGGGKLSTPGLVLQGQPGSRVTGLVRFTADTSIRGVLFDSPGHLAALCTLDKNCTVVFAGCRFRKTRLDVGNYVTMTAGCKAHFVGCFFEGTPAAGNVVNNAGLAANLFIIGCSNKTGRLHANVTTIAETT